MNKQTNDSTPVRPAIPDELQDSLTKIIAYSGIEKEKADLFRANVESFISLKDKYAVNTQVLKMKETVGNVFFEIYGLVAKKVWAEKNSSRLYQMFLNYAYMDERLMKPEHIIDLYNASPLDQELFSIHTMKNWLEKICTAEKDPSVNEFEQDYFDIFREKKKRGELTESDKAAYERDADARLSHETEGLLKIGQRLCYGKTSGYFPILYSEILPGDISRLLVKASKINECLAKITRVDFSLFHRETVYYNTEKNISSSLIMKPVWPDIILVPGFGAKGSMWQELTGRAKNSPARFLCPILTDENLEHLIIEIVAKFRWQLAKTMSSGTINRAYEKSLYADYSNYIQGFKKNQQLSEEAKRKIKTQIDRKRNFIGEIFADDYQIWVNFESQGLLRLNKVVRGILFQYCPFAKPLRENLMNHPQFNQIISQFEFAHNKNRQRLQNVYKNLSLDEDLKDNLAYYEM